MSLPDLLALVELDWSRDDAPFTRAQDLFVCRRHSSSTDPAASFAQFRIASSNNSGSRWIAFLSKQSSVQHLVAQGPLSRDNHLPAHSDRNGACQSLERALATSHRDASSLLSTLKAGDQEGQPGRRPFPKPRMSRQDEKRRMLEKISSASTSSHRNSSHHAASPPRKQRDSPPQDVRAPAHGPGAEDPPASRGMVIFTVLFYLVAALVMVGWGLRALLNRS